MKVHTFSCHNGDENIASPLFTPVVSLQRVPCEHLKSLLLNKNQNAFLINAQPHEDRHFLIFHSSKKDLKQGHHLPTQDPYKLILSYRVAFSDTDDIIMHLATRSEL